MHKRSHRPESTEAEQAYYGQDIVDITHSQGPWKSEPTQRKAVNKHIKEIKHTHTQTHTQSKSPREKIYAKTFKSTRMYFKEPKRKKRDWLENMFRFECIHGHGLHCSTN